MGRGLDLILNKIREQPSPILAARYLTLIAELQNEDEKRMRALDLAEVLIKTRPKESLRLALLAHRSQRQDLRSLDVMIAVMHSMGKLDRAAVLQEEKNRVADDINRQQINFNEINPQVLNLKKTLPLGSGHVPAQNPAQIPTQPPSRFPAQSQFAFQESSAKFDPHDKVNRGGESRVLEAALFDILEASDDPPPKKLEPLPMPQKAPEPNFAPLERTEPRKTQLSPRIVRGLEGRNPSDTVIGIRAHSEPPINPGRDNNQERPFVEAQLSLDLGSESTNPEPLQPNPSILRSTELADLNPGANPLPELPFYPQTSLSFPAVPESDSKLPDLDPMAGSFVEQGPEPQNHPSFNQLNSIKLTPFLNTVLNSTISKDNTPSDRKLENSSLWPREHRRVLDIDFKQQLIAKIKKDLQSQQTGPYWEFFQSLWGQNPTDETREILEASNLAQHSPGFWGLYLDSLVTTGDYRRGLWEIRRTLGRHPVFPWVMVGHQRLGTLWKGLGVKGFSWVPEQGVPALLAGLARPPVPLMAGMAGIAHANRSSTDSQERSHNAQELQKRVATVEP